MKKTIILLTTISLVGVLLFSSSCNKNDKIAPAPVVPTTSQWTFNGTTYNPTATPGYITEFNNFLLESRGIGQDGVYIFFGSATPSAGEYKVISGNSSINGGIASNQCYIEIKTTTSGIFYSSGAANDTVKVILSAGKVVATFNNITVATNPSSAVPNNKTVSGTLVQTPTPVVS